MSDLPAFFRQALPALSSPRLFLRAFDPADAEILEGLINDPQIAAGTLAIPHPYPEGAGLPWIEGHAESWRVGKGATWAVTRRGAMSASLPNGAMSASLPNGAMSASLLGAMSLRLTLAHRRGEIGYWIARAAWGNGYATEAVRAVIAFAFDDLGLHRVDAHHFVENTASGQVMRKAGMRSEGRRRGAFFRAGVPRDVEEYAILRTDPRG